MGEGREIDPETDPLLAEVNGTPPVEDMDSQEDLSDPLPDGWVDPDTLKKAWQRRKQQG